MALTAMESAELDRLNDRSVYLVASIHGILSAALVDRIAELEAIRDYEQRAPVIAAAIRAGITAIDFCGDADEGVEDVAFDEDIVFTARERGEIARRISAEWQRMRRAARWA